MKVGLFGGSFNPIHNGHVKLIEEILAKKLVDEVWVMPCKEHAFGKNLVSEEKRVEMLELALKGFDKVKINKLELENQGKSYTAETVRKLKQQYNHEFYLIIGGDNLSGISSWYDFSYLLENVNFVIVQREDFDLKDSGDLKVKQFVPLEVDISSSQVRDLVKIGRLESVEELVPENVLDYIKKEGLYL